MSNEIQNLRTGIYLMTLMVFLISGCATNYDSNGAIHEIEVSLNGDQSVPPVATESSGKGIIKVNIKSGEIGGSTILNGFSATKVHIHRGEMGQNGKVVVTLEQDADNANKYTIPAFTKLSKTDLNTLLSDGMYYQAHSKKYPKGEVRGQILMPTGYDYY